jgi:hypothetical protein
VEEGEGSGTRGWPSLATLTWVAGVDLLEGLRVIVGNATDRERTRYTQEKEVHAVILLLPPSNLQNLV